MPNDFLVLIKKETIPMANPRSASFWRNRRKADTWLVAVSIPRTVRTEMMRSGVSSGTILERAAKA
jgi:hypothetical protein